MKISALWPQGMHEEAKTVITPKHTLLRHVVYCCGRFAGNIKYIPDKYDYMNLEWANLQTALLINSIFISTKKKYMNVIYTQPITNL